MSLVGAGTMLSAAGSLAEGKAADQSAKFKAKTQMATGTRKAAESKRAGDIVASNARAQMAAGGGSASDAGSIETLGKIKSEAEYNALADMYEAKTDASISRYEGKVAKKASRMKALSTVLSGGSKAYGAYKG